MNHRGFYTVRELALLASVTVRTLHHYDEIGLLSPADRTGAGYRLYGRDELLRLQQILFFRELGMPLADIRESLGDPGFDTVRALKAHRAELRERMKRLRRLVETIDHTIASMEEEAVLSDEQLYEGFSKEQREVYSREASERWPEEYAAVTARVRKMTPERWKSIGAEGEEVTRRLAELVGEEPTSDAVQETVARHHAWIENFYPCDADRYTGLAEMYVADERFAAYYDQHAPGLAKHLSSAMKHFARTHLT